MSNKQTGRIAVKLNGDQLVSKAGASLQIGGTRREAVTADDGRTYFRETVVAPMVKATLIHTSETDLLALRDFTDGTINFETDTGRVYVIPNAFSTETGDLANGEVEVSFSGDPVEQN